MSNITLSDVIFENEQSNYNGIIYVSDLSSISFNNIHFKVRKISVMKILLFIRIFKAWKLQYLWFLMSQEE